MGDMIRCGKCSTHHYRNDPCPEFAQEESLAEYCPQCLLDVSRNELKANEGYCANCCRENQRDLDRHNREFDNWNSLTEFQREALIRFGIGGRGGNATGD